MRYKLCILFAATIVFMSCERKLRAPDMNGTSTSGLIGEWKFIATQGTTNATSEMTLAGDRLKIEAIMNYVSNNAKGIYKINSATMDAVGVSYDYTGRIVLNSYENNILETSDTTILPVTPYGPLSNSTGYKTVGTDSITFTTNTPGVQLPNGGTMTSPGGCRYKIEGNRLTMFIKHTSTTTGSSGGILTTDRQIIDVNLVLERQ